MLRSKAIAQVVVIVAVFGLSVAALWFLIISSDTPVEPTDLQEVVVVPVREGTIDREFAVTLSPVLGAPETVFIASDGLVTSIETEVGQTIGNGDEVLSLDNHVRRAMVSPQPIARPLSLNSEGPEVEWLQTYLVELGYLDPSLIDGNFGSNTRRAVREFNEALGLTGVRQFTFDPSMVVWIGADPFVVAELNVQAGSRISVGAEFMSALPELIALEVNEPDEAPPIGGHQWEVTLGSGAHPIDRNSGEVSGPSLLSEVQPEVALDPESSIPATIRLAEPREVQLVPAAAVVLDDTGKRCIYIPAAQGGFAPILVEVTGGGLGIVEIDKDRNLTDVVANPASIGLGDTCT